MRQGQYAGAERLARLTAEHAALVMLVERQGAALRQAVAGDQQRELTQLVEKRGRALSELACLQVEVEAMLKGTECEFSDADRDEALGALATASRLLGQTASANQEDMRLLRIRRAEIAETLQAVHQVGTAMHAYRGDGGADGFDVLGGETA